MLDAAGGILKRGRAQEDREEHLDELSILPDRKKMKQTKEERIEDIMAGKFIPHSKIQTNAVVFHSRVSTFFFILLSHVLLHTQKTCLGVGVRCAV